MSSFFVERLGYRGSTDDNGSLNTNGIAFKPLKLTHSYNANEVPVLKPLDGRKSPKLDKAIVIGRAQGLNELPFI
uniref:Uncharacterized protein n=1 Tax=Glossina palpalis gambiensis TaxID=67801 RepID=A0A1B0AXB9_9MUSC